MATLTFDDLIPQSAPPPAVVGGLSFDDLIPTDNRAGQFSSPAALNAPGPVDTTTDVIRSAAAGLRRGVVALPGLPGSIEQLGRAGIDLAARTAGLTDPRLSERTFLPTGGDYLQRDQDPNYRPAGLSDTYWRPGAPHYEPQTTAGEYARTAGEFAPGALLPGGVVQRIGLNVAAPAVVSETAGQITKGTKAEPWARAAGAIVGPYVPGVLARIVTPNPTTPERAAQVATLRAEGVNSTTAGQETGRRPLQWLESVTGDMTLAGGRTAQRLERQAEEFTAAALRRAGITANRATPDVIDGAFTRIGQQFDNLSANTSVNLDRRFIDAIDNVATDYNKLVPETMRAPIIQDVVDVARQWRGTAMVQPGGMYLPGRSAGLMDGADYMALRSRLARDARGTADPQLSRALHGFREALDDAMQRSMPRDVARDWATARREYRNMLVIERAATGGGENAAMGLISPAQLRVAARAQDLRAYARGQNEFADLARAGNAIMTPLPQSGTAPRAGAQGLLTLAATGGGALLGGPPGAVGGAAAAITANALAPGLVGRGLMSTPVQGYLRNQALANAMAEFAPREGALAAVPGAAREAGPAAQNAMANPQSGTQQNPVPVKGRADVERLPRGAYVIDESGQIYRRR